MPDRLPMISTLFLGCVMLFGAGCTDQQPPAALGTDSAGASQASRSNAVQPSQDHSAQPSMYRDLIVLDGVFDDWSSFKPVLDEPGDDATGGSPIDLGPLRITHDEQFVHMQLDLGAVVNLQVLPDDTSIELLLDVDGNASTGTTEPIAAGSNDADQTVLRGTDAIITFSAAGSRGSRMGIALGSTTYTPDLADPEAIVLNPYDVGLAFAPTYASDRVEIRLVRGSQPHASPMWFKNPHFAAALRVVGSDGRTLDVIDRVQYPLTPLAWRPDSPSRDMPPATGEGLRVMNWNVERGALFTNPEPFAQVFGTINPDVILLEELKNTQSAEMVDAWFEQYVPGDDASALADRWHVLVGAGGGDLRCAIVSRLPLEPLAGLGLVAFADNPKRQVRVAAATIEYGGKQLLLVATHLKCCGWAGSREDDTRVVEVSLLREALARSLKSTGIDGLVVSGDLNLVGSRTPLDDLVNRGDLDGSDLQIADLMQLDRHTNATWHDPNQPFVPGRLDWLVLSDSSLTLLDGFVFDSRDLSGDALEQHRIEAGATMGSSDHFPLVADVTWRREQAP